MIFRYALRIPALSALLLLLSACATTDVDERIDLAPELAGTVEIGQVVTSETQGGLLQVDARLRNLMDRPLLLTYQFQWLDAEGRAVETLLSRKSRATAERRRWISISGTAPNPEVTDFRLYLDEREI